jgi:tetratricopeptide (TPR) repeat protein
MTLYNETSIEHYIEQGLAFHSHQDFKNALSCYQKALSYNTQNPKLWFLMGTALYQVSQFNPKPQKPSYRQVNFHKLTPPDLIHNSHNTYYGTKMGVRRRQQGASPVHQRSNLVVLFS